VFKLLFTPEARKDIADAARYYEEKLQGLGRRLKKDVRDKLLLIKDNPYAYSIRYGQVRIASVKKFPYSIHFVVYGQNIFVYAFLSDYRDPEQYWVKE